MPVTATASAALLALTLTADAGRADALLLDLTLSSPAPLELRWAGATWTASTAARHRARLPDVEGAELVVAGAGGALFRGRTAGPDGDVAVVPPGAAPWVTLAYARALAPPPRRLVGPRPPTLAELPPGALVVWSPTPTDGASVEPAPGLRVRAQPLDAVLDSDARAPVEVLLAPSGLSCIEDARGAIVSVGLGLGPPPAILRPLDAVIEQHAVGGLARVDRGHRLTWVTLEGVVRSPARAAPGALLEGGHASRRLAGVALAAALVGASFCLFLWRLVRHGAG